MKPYLPMNKIFYPENVAVFLNTFNQVKGLCCEISILKLKILNSISEPTKLINFKEQLRYITNFMAKKHQLFKICKLLKKTEYWTYNPLQMVITWTIGPILEDEWTWCNLF